MQLTWGRVERRITPQERQGQQTLWMRHDWLRFDAVLFEALTKNESVKAGLAGEIAIAVREGGRRFEISPTPHFAKKFLEV